MNPVKLHFTTQGQDISDGNVLTAAGFPHRRPVLGNIGLGVIDTNTLLEEAD